MAKDDFSKNSFTSSTENMEFSDISYENMQKSASTKFHFQSCLDNTQRILQTELPVFHLLESIREAGCEPPRIACVDCDSEKRKIMSGFNSESNRLFLCFDAQPVTKGPHSLRYEVFRMNVMHELVHAYDHCRANVDFSNLKHHACSEIRASALSSECNYRYEKKTGNASLKDYIGHFHECVKRRAATSISQNPNFDSMTMDAMDIVEDRYEQCYNDIQPFVGRPYRL